MKKTEREMLVLAAKAIGMKIDPIDAEHEPKDWAAWNPLVDDGDAFRLVVLLGLDIEYGDKQVWYCQEDMKNYIMHPFADDRAAAARRVIVESAASIGESMP